MCVVHVCTCVVYACTHVCAHVPVCSAWWVLQRPGVDVSKLAELFPELGHLAEQPALVRRLEIESHYSNMITKQESEVVDMRRSEALQLPPDLPYHKYGHHTAMHGQIQ